MPRRTTTTESLKFLLGGNGLAWGTGDHVLPKRSRDALVRRAMQAAIGSGTPLRRSNVQAEMIAAFEEATRLFFEKKALGQLDQVNEVEFIWEVWTRHRLHFHLVDRYFAQLFVALLRARADFLDGKFQKAPQPPLLGMAIDAFVDASRGFFGGEILALYIDQGAMGADDDDDDEAGEQATALRALETSLPGPSASSSFPAASPAGMLPSVSASSAPGHSWARAEAEEYDSDEFAGVSASEDEEEEEDEDVEMMAAGVQAMALDEDGDVAMGA